MSSYNLMIMIMSNDKIKRLHFTIDTIKIMSH